MLSELAERDLGFEELWRGSWSVLKKQWLRIVLSVIGLSILGSLAIGAVAMFLRWVLPTSPSDIANFNVFQFLIGFLTVLMANITLCSLLVIPIILIAENAIKQQPISWKQILRQTFVRIPACLWTSFLVGIIGVGLMLVLLSLILLGSALSLYHISGVLWLIFPILIVACVIYYVFAINAAALRGLSGAKALSYAWSLIKGRWLRTFAAIIPLIIIHILAVSFFAMIFFNVVDDSNFHQEVFKNVGKVPPDSQLVLPKLPLTAIITGTVLQIVGELWCVFSLIFMTLLFLNFDNRRHRVN